MENKILDKINSPKDLKSLSKKELKTLAGEIRKKIIDIVSKNGGHLASNLGVVELTIALHSVFESPKDKIVWDVGHQSYVHKILTGRKDQLHTLRLKGGLSGFPKRSESEHDVVETGHSSTSISSALGILVGQQIQKKEGKVIAVIGDGSLTGGMAFEALNNAGHLNKNLIIILNDNNMSISENVGAVSAYLSRITATDFYRKFRNSIDMGVKTIPFFGHKMLKGIYRLKKGIKAIFFKESLFTDLGFQYVGPIDGHNISTLKSVLRNVKFLNAPVVVHVRTKKGKGYEYAEWNPTLYHGVSPFSIIDGKIEKKTSMSFTEAFSDGIMNLAEKNDKIAAITAAMSTGTGLSLFQKKYPERFFDVGITEQHAVTFASGLAVSGLKPIVAIYSTFMQRAVDQVMHDVCLQNLSVIFCLDRAGLVGNDGETHQGLYDISIFKSLPNLKILCPVSYSEMQSMLEYSVDVGGPVMLRYPKAVCSKEIPAFSEKIKEGEGVFISKSNSEILLMNTGGLLDEVMMAVNILREKGIDCDLYNMRFVKPLDTNKLIKIMSSYRYILHIEDSAEIGGQGEGLAALLNSSGININFDYIGVPDVIYPHASRTELIKMSMLDSESIIKRVREEISKIKYFSSETPMEDSISG